MRSGTSSPSISVDAQSPFPVETSLPNGGTDPAPLIALLLPGRNSRPSFSQNQAPPPRLLLLGPRRRLREGCGGSRVWAEVVGFAAVAAWFGMGGVARG